MKQLIKMWRIWMYWLTFKSGNPYRPLRPALASKPSAQLIASKWGDSVPGPFRSTCAEKTKCGTGPSRIALVNYTFFDALLLLERRRGFLEHLVNFGVDFRVLILGDVVHLEVLESCLEGHEQSIKELVAGDIKSKSREITFCTRSSRP